MLTQPRDCLCWEGGGEDAQSINIYLFLTIDAFEIERSERLPQEEQKKLQTQRSGKRWRLTRLVNSCHNSLSQTRNLP